MIYRQVNAAKQIVTPAKIVKYILWFNESGIKMQWKYQNELQWIHDLIHPQMHDTFRLTVHE
jgi:hypothetical protein